MDVMDELTRERARIERADELRRQREAERNGYEYKPQWEYHYTRDDNWKGRA